MTDAELDALERLNADGDAVPWEADIDGGLWTGKWYTGDRRGSWATNGSDSEERERRNVALLTAARNALPTLIAEVRRLRADPEMRSLEVLRALYPGSRLHTFAENAHGDLPRLRAAERLAEEALRVDDEPYGWGEFRGVADAQFFASIVAYRKAKAR